MAATSSLPRESDRRAAPRYYSGLETSCVPLRVARVSPWPARVWDISAQGISLVLSQACDPGKFLIVLLRPLQSADQRPVHAEVVRTIKRTDFHWMLGCSLAEPLADDEVQACRAKPGILIVDDDAAVGKLLELGLGAAGFSTRYLNSGPKAIEHFRQHHEAISAVLLDVQMPGLDGPQTLAQLKQIDPEVRACFLSGDLGKYSAEELLEHGAARIIRKPFALAQVNDALWQLIREPRGQACSGVAATVSGL